MKNTQTKINLFSTPVVIENDIHRLDDAEMNFLKSLPLRKSDFNSKGELKKQAPKYYIIKKNDLDKLVRSTLDGLTGVAYKDDSQVIRILASKRYADFEDEGAEIFIHALDI